VVTNPKAVYMTADMIQDGQITEEDQKIRLKELVDETILLASRSK
jgi:predicted metalloprotease